MATKGKRRPRSFYLNALDEAERLEFQAAANIEGIDIRVFIYTSCNSFRDSFRLV